MKSKECAIFILCLIVVLVLFLFFVQVWPVSKAFPRNVEVLGLKAFYFFAARTICTILLLFVISSFFYRVYQIFYFYSAVHFSWGAFGIDLISIFMLLALIFAIIPGLIIVNGVILLSYLSAYQIDGITSPEVHSLVGNMLEGVKSESIKIDSMNGQMFIFSETEDKQRYLCADVYKLIEKPFPSSLMRIGAVQTLEFLNVPDVACTDFHPIETSKPH